MGGDVGRGGRSRPPTFATNYPVSPVSLCILRTRLTQTHAESMASVAYYTYSGILRASYLTCQTWRKCFVPSCAAVKKGSTALCARGPEMMASRGEGHFFSAGKQANRQTGGVCEGVRRPDPRCLVLLWHRAPPAKEQNVSSGARQEECRTLSYQCLPRLERLDGEAVARSREGSPDQRRPGTIIHLGINVSTEYLRRIHIHRTRYLVLLRRPKRDIVVREIGTGKTHYHSTTYATLICVQIISLASRGKGLGSCPAFATYVSTTYCTVCQLWCEPKGKSCEKYRQE